MSLHISFHRPGLIDVHVVNDELTSLDIYDGDEPYGSRVTLYFANPTEVDDWANRISLTAKKGNIQYVLNRLGV